MKSIPSAASKASPPTGLVPEMRSVSQKNTSALAARLIRHLVGAVWQSQQRFK